MKSMKSGKQFSLSLAKMQRKRKRQDDHGVLSSNESDCSEQSTQNNMPIPAVGDIVVRPRTAENRVEKEDICHGRETSSVLTCSSLHNVLPRKQGSFEKPRSILSWLKHSPNPSKTVACPVCERAVHLPHINRHLDSGCDLYVVSKDLSREASVKEEESHYNEEEKTQINCEVPNQPDTEKMLTADVTTNVTEGVGNAKGKIITSKSEGKESYGCSDANFPKNHIITTHPSTGKTEDSFEEQICGPVNEQEGNSEMVENPAERSEAMNHQEPYYFANFKLVLNTVLGNSEDIKLFNSDDNHIINTFKNLSQEGQKLYIRLFQRNWGWFRCSKLDYQGISPDLRPVISLLKEKGFLKGEENLTELADVLSLVPAPELRNLAKELHITLKSSRCKGENTKESLMGSLIHHGKKQRSLFGNSAGVILKRAKQMLGSCVKVSKESRGLFSRIILLFTMNMIPDDDHSTQAQELSSLYLVNSKKVVYPEYTICRPSPVFQNRDELLRFSAASQDKHEMFTSFENKDFEVALQYYPKAAENFKEILSDLEKISSSKTSANLPIHLRCFTAEFVYTKMCYLGVEILQKQRRYDEAVTQLELLLRQNVFCQESRGKWFDRLALNLHQHLKQPSKALEVIKRGLVDPNVRAGRRLALMQRAKRILTSPGYQKKKTAEVEDFGDLSLEEPNAPKTVTISGRRSAELGVFISNEVGMNGADLDCTKTFCSVEEFAMAHYRQQGYNQGIHGEGSTFTTLFGLLMWDVIFADGIPDVFRGPFQSAPLDIFSDSFYETRQSLFEKRLETLQAASAKQLQELLEESWCEHEGQVCVGVKWDRFTGISQAKQLVSCFGGKFLAGVFAIFAKSYRYRCSGIPDLVVWNPSSLEYKIVEVKGPGDRLSTKQQIWLDELSSLGAQAEVCYVTAVGAKRLKVS